MAYATAFEQRYAAVGNTELWKILKNKTEEKGLSTDFLNAVGEVCDKGVTLSKDIIRFFPTFTLHDETHIVNVCNWMTRLLGERKNELSAHEAALLVMAACCHDIGMSVSEDQKKVLQSNPKSSQWKNYFNTHLKDEEEFSENNTISDQMLRNFVRTNHHTRVSAHITSTFWPNELTKQQITRSTFINLCQSHGEPIDNLKVPRGLPFDLRLCAVLLRLADILDFDSSRAPDNLFKHLGLDYPDSFEESISQAEWFKNRAGIFGDIQDGILPFTASYTSLQLECEVQLYLDWVVQELESSIEYLSKYDGEWKSLVLPHKISTDCVERNGYKFGKFCLTMDQDRILNLLTGRNLYSDPGVFVRELLQNSIDAVLNRSTIDPTFNKSDGKIVIRTWMDNEGYSWFRIEDNGTGMDENIITNFFLKVGRSYYTSDEFKADKRRYGNGKDYTPISRFGIGILSCFMSDPDNNLLEVSTKRFSPDISKPNSGIRMNVTGLHGYYYLAQEDEQTEEEFFQPMHHPQNNDYGYRSEAGTTICVRVNLYQLGNYRSFKEIVDRYVQFPEVQVEYHGPEGFFEYPTQKKLMDAVHSLNPDGPDKEPKEYVYPISDEQFEQLKSEMSYITWEGKPDIVLKYYPLDWIANNENIQGVAIFADVRATAKCPSIEYKGKTFSTSFGCSIRNILSNGELEITFSNSFPDSFINEEMYLIDNKFRSLHRYESILNNDIHEEIMFKLSHTLGVEQNDISAFQRYNQLNTPIHIDISYDDLFMQISEEESMIFQYVIGALKCIRPQLSNGYSITLTAYNGILADVSDLFGKDFRYVGLLLLLQGEHCPEVNLARDTISSLTLETACNLTLVQRRLPGINYSYNKIPEPFHPKQFALLSEYDLQQMLNKHPEWKEQLLLIDNHLAMLKQMLNKYPEMLLQILNKHPEWKEQLLSKGNSLAMLQQRVLSKVKVEVGNFQNSLYDYLCLAALKMYFTIYNDGFRSANNYITSDPKDNSTADFPVSMFFMFPKSNSSFGNISSNWINCYNKEHRLSRWLIQHQKDLQEQIPGIYKNLLETMVLSDSKSEVLEAVNAALTRIKGFKNNLFDVSDDLFLKDADLN